jgi:xanthine/uracil permease
MRSPGPGRRGGVRFRRRGLSHDRRSRAEVILRVIKYQNEPLLRVVVPAQFGMPRFHLVPNLTMCLVITIVFIEATGMFLALGSKTGRQVGAEDVERGLRADAIGAIFNTFPCVSYSQNIGLVGVTGVYSR